nr:hypothetical protein [Lysobacter enzymogenes]
MRVSTRPYVAGALPRLLTLAKPKPRTSPVTANASTRYAAGAGPPALSAPGRLARRLHRAQPALGEQALAAAADAAVDGGEPAALAEADPAARVDRVGQAVGGRRHARQADAVLVAEPRRHHHAAAAGHGEVDEVIVVAAEVDRRDREAGIDRAVRIHPLQAAGLGRGAGGVADHQHAAVGLRRQPAGDLQVRAVVSGVEAAVGVVAQQRSAHAAAGDDGMAAEEFAVGLQHQPLRAGIEAGDAVDGAAVLAEARVGAAVAQIARDQVPASAAAGDDDLAVGLQQHVLGAGALGLFGMRGHHHAVAAEAAVGVAVAAVARQHHRILAAVGVETLAGGDDAAVGLQREAVELVEAAGVEGLHAVAREAAVGLAVGEKAQQQRIALVAAGDEDAAVGLHRQRAACGGLRVGAQLDPHLPAVAEAGVELAVGAEAQQPAVQVIAMQRRVAAAFADGEDLAVGLDGDGADEVVVHREVGDDQAAAAEGGIERAVGQLGLGRGGGERGADRQRERQAALQHRTVHGGSCCEERWQRRQPPASAPRGETRPSASAPPWRERTKQHIRRA